MEWELQKNIAFASVKNVLEKGTVILPLDNHNIHGKKQKTGMIAAPIEIDGERYVCVVEVKAIQRHIETLHENTDTSNGLYFKKGNYLYKFNTSLRQYADNRRDGHDGHDGFEVLEKYDISKLNKEQLRSIKHVIENRGNIDSVLSKQGPWNEEGNLYDSDVIVDNRETAGYNDRLDNETLQGETNRGRGDRSDREDKGEDYGVVTEKNLEKGESEEQRQVGAIRQWHRDKLMFGNLSQEQKDYLKEEGISVEDLFVTLYPI
ncbi:MAG: hypothetical protein K5633_05275 [Paludibacteraceae bacterium]|nr:hypothetical protein [Paludibacteraceae bacterium]